MICLKIGHSVPPASPERWRAGFEKLLHPEIIEYIFLLNHLTTQLFNDILYTHTENIFKVIKFPVSSFKFLSATATKPL